MMRPNRARLALGIALALAIGAHARQPERLDPRAIHLHAGTVRTDEARADLAATIRAGVEPGRRHVVQLDGPMTPARRDALLGAGIEVGDYLPIDAYIVRLERANAGAVARLGFVRWHGRFEDSWKLNPELGRRAPMTQPRRALADAGREALLVTLFAGAAPDEARRALLEMPGVAVLAEELVAGAVVMSVEAGAGDAAGIARLADVQHIEPAPEITLRNASTRWIVQSNIDGVTPLYDAGIRGEGQIVGILDEAVDKDHCSFLDADNPVGPDHRKIVAYNGSFAREFHGTHVAGTAVGEAGSADDTRGIAYMGRLVYGRIPGFGESGIRSALQRDHDQGARVHTNSWGNDGTTQYDGLCRGIDAFSHEQEESLVLFAVTNTSRLKNPENAKNLVAVGASRDAPSQHLHCSGGRGPTSDLRRKPEVYAPGCDTGSARSGTTCSTARASGTSMAAPAVAGAAMLVRQYYADGFYPSGVADPNDAFVPSAALVKATIINGSVDMTGVSGYPSDTEGWGRVRLAGALHLDGVSDGRLLITDTRNAGGLTSGATAEQSVLVVGGQPQLRVTLVWTDPPATSGASVAAVNDLDLVVVAPDGTEYLGNVFAGGVSVPGGTADDRNNVEQVHIDGAASGAWTVRVRAARVAIGRQGYALVVSGPIALDEPCLADCDGSGSLDIRDFFCFQGRFAAGDERADCDGSGALDIRDFFCFQALFAAGCR